MIFARHPERLDVVTQPAVVMRNPEVRVDNGIAQRLVGEPERQAGRKQQRRRRPGIDQSVRNALIAAGGYFALLARKRRNRIKERVRNAGAVVVVDITEVLIAAADSDVIAKKTIGRRAADFDGSLVIKGRITNAELARPIAGISTGLENLIDVAGDALRVGACVHAAGVDLNFLAAQAGEHRLGSVVVDAIDRNTVELVSNLIDIAAADLELLPPTLLAGIERNARNRRDRTVRVVETARTAETLSCLLAGSVHRIHVRGLTGFEEIRRCRRRDARDRLERLGHRHVEGLYGVGEDRDARLRLRIVSLFGKRDRVRIRP